MENPSKLEEVKDFIEACYAPIPAIINLGKVVVGILVEDWKKNS